jgi:hypothetical protein
MRALGMLTSLVLGAALVAAVAVGVRSAPDVRRYLAMRRM